MLMMLTMTVTSIGLTVLPVERRAALKVSESAWKKDSEPVISR